jgi:allantoinase
MPRFDLVVTNADVVLPGVAEPERIDIGILDGRIAAVGKDAEPSSAAEVLDASGLVALPGGVDAHQHWGIYNPLSVDAESESRAAASGGVTTGINYMRTGQYYMNASGPYREIFPKVLAETEGHAFIDYAFHLAPMMKEHIDEIPSLVTDFGVTSFKIFMFYGSHGLHGRSTSQNDFLMIPEDERYDIAHFEFVMRGIQKARREHPEYADRISLSLHCETAEIMTAYTKLVEEAGELSGLAAYSASRPQHSEGLAVTIASYLAHETELPTINLLHLSSEKAVDAALRMARTFPEVDFRREVTAGPPARRHRHRRRHRRQGQSAAPPARRRRGALVARARRRDRLGCERPRLLPRRAEVQCRAPRRRLPREVWLRRRRVPHPRHGERGTQARDELPRDRGHGLHPSRRALRPRQQG